MQEIKLFLHSLPNLLQTLPALGFMLQGLARQVADVMVPIWGGSTQESNRIHSCQDDFVANAKSTTT